MAQPPSRCRSDSLTVDDQLKHRDRAHGSLDGVAGGFGVVAASGRGGPAEGAVGQLVDGPARLLLEAMVMTTLRAAVAQAGPAACLVWHVVLVVAGRGGSPAHRAGAGRVPDLGQVPEPGPGIVAPGLVPVLAVRSVQGVDRDDQVRSATRNAQPPGAVPAGRPVPAGRGEGEPRRPWPGAFPVTLGCGPGAAVPDGV